MTRELFHQNISKAILAGIFLLIFFSIRITNIFIILYLVNWLVGNTMKTWSWQKQDWLLLLIISPWILDLISILYSTHMVIGLHQVEKRFALIAIPIITLHSANNAVKDRTTIFHIGTMCTVLVTFYCLLVALYNFLFKSEKMAYWEDFTQPIIFAPVYVSLIINIVSIWIIYKLVREWLSLALSQKILYLSLITYLGIITFLVASKLHSVIFIVIIIMGLVLIYHKHVVSWKASLGIVVLLFAIGFSIFKSEIKERFADIHNITIPRFDAPDVEFNELTLRLTIFKCATYIIKENPVFGTGVGDVMADLESAYRKVDFKFGYNNAYDPHNQYLRVCIGTGVFGLALFLTSLITVLIMALRSGDWLVLGFMVLFCISFLFESILERHNGIIVYAFFYSILIFGIDDNKRQMLDQVD
jgi:O-antigen ligase